MKRILPTVVLLLLSLSLAAEDLEFNHGPYLQNMDKDEVTIFFTTNKKAVAQVEVECKEWNGTKYFHTVNDGFIDAYTTNNAIRVTGLKPGTEYRYRLIAKEIKKFQPYKIEYGDSIASEWEKFCITDYNKAEYTFAIINDIHDNNDKLHNLLNLSSQSTADAVFYLGDMISYCDRQDTPYKGFIDTSVEVFAKNKPFIMIRGNHETRGAIARKFKEYVGCPNNRFYNVFYYGHTAIIVLDTGEDKPDTHPVYGGINRFDDYRTEQAYWLQEEIRSKRFRKTKNRIVLMHIPPIDIEHINSPEEHANRHITENLLPILNKADIDLIVSGHTHKHYFVEKNTMYNEFPLLVNDNNSVVDLKINKKNIKVKVTAKDGNVTFEKEFQ